MIKKFVSLVILLSMILHCSSRLGILSYIYKNRRAIGYWLGMHERTISSCDSHYFIGQQLSVIDDHEDDLPVNIQQAFEIILFFQPGIIENTIPAYKDLTKSETPYLQRPYHFHRAGVFHPPATV